MVTARVNHAKVVAWTTNVKMNFEGTISACAVTLFENIENANTREKILRVLASSHERLTVEGR